jgi:nitroreductase
MNYVEAISVRHSRRTYVGEPVDDKRLNKLQQLADRYNREANLNIQLVGDGRKAFDGLSKSYGLFKNVRSLIVLVGNKTDAHLQEKLGYYGELLLLEATTLGLSTCWVGGTFDRSSTIVPLRDDESLECVITMGDVAGETLKEKLIHSLVARKSKPLHEFYTSDVDLPLWIIEGLKAVQKAPSAVNKQPVKFEYTNNELTAFVGPVTRFELFDLGIAKAHFALATGCSFEWGSGGRLKKE